MAAIIIAMSISVCLSACLLVCLKATRPNFSALYQWPWLGRPLEVHNVDDVTFGHKQTGKGEASRAYSQWLTRGQNRFNTALPLLIGNRHMLSDSSWGGACGQNVLSIIGLLSMWCCLCISSKLHFAFMNYYSGHVMYWYQTQAQPAASSHHVWLSSSMLQCCVVSSQVFF